MFQLSSAQSSKRFFGVLSHYSFKFSFETDFESFIQRSNQSACPGVKEAIADDWIFQQDGASCHTSNDSQNLCQENLPGFIPKDIWPANSPDLNPLDYSIWNQMVQEMNWNAIKWKQTLIKQLYIAINKIQAHQILDISNKWYSRVRNLQINNNNFIQ
ncbi:hypothetical protein ABPG72_020135 [Tetrahymena utriculariae]